MNKLDGYRVASIRRGPVNGTECEGVHLFLETEGSEPIEEVAAINGSGPDDAMLLALLRAAGVNAHDERAWSILCMNHSRGINPEDCDLFSIGRIRVESNRFAGKVDLTLQTPRGIVAQLYVGDVSDRDKVLAQLMLSLISETLYSMEFSS